MGLDSWKPLNFKELSWCTSRLRLPEFVKEVFFLFLSAVFSSAPAREPRTDVRSMKSTYIRCLFPSLCIYPLESTNSLPAFPCVSVPTTPPSHLHTCILLPEYLSCSRISFCTLCAYNCFCSARASYCYCCCYCCSYPLLWSHVA